MSNSESENNNSTNNKIRKRSPQWRDEEVEALLFIWEENLEEMIRCKRKKHLFEKMSRTLKDVGITRSQLEISVKISNLTKECRRERTKECSAWKFFGQVNKLIGRLPRNANILEENCAESLNMEENYDSGMMEVFENVPVEVSHDLSSSNESGSNSNVEESGLNVQVITKKRKKESNNSSSTGGGGGGGSSHNNSRDELWREFFNQEQKNTQDFHNFLKENLQIQRQSLELQKSLLDLLKTKM